MTPSNKSTTTLLKITLHYLNIMTSKPFQLDNFRTPDERYTYDYQKIPLDNVDNKKDYVAAQRRADIYRQLKEEYGYIGNLPSSRDLGEEYGVSHTTIVEDMDEIRKYILDHDMQEDRVASKVNSALERLADRAAELGEEAEDASDVKQAAQTVKEFKKWIQETGSVEKEPEQVEHKGDAVNVSFDLNENNYDKDSDESEEQ